MFRRILRSTIVLAAIIAAYEAYALFAVPCMEPSLAVREQRRVDLADLKDAPESVSKYQRLLANYFPPDHWSQLRPPKVIGPSDQWLIVVDDYTRHPAVEESDKTTLLDVNKLVMVIFPHPPHEGDIAPRDAIILDAPQGAHLLIDDFHPEMGRIGQIRRGTFPGAITIHSDMREPGPADDLLVQTSDLKMNTKLLYSDSEVKFQLGANLGRGRELEIRFLSDEHLQPRKGGLHFSGFDTLEIRRDVRMRMQIDTTSLLPDNGEKVPPSPSVQVSDAAKKVPATPKPPVDITCNGPFTFDFVRDVASVDRDVVVRQLNPNGPFDQL
ncbi:MAG TPA: hypothetical protein VHE81_23335, partial [Lacipirellulaceae bacterium]|nr:hypothetical protein [Lacipirellulaceae bacterium]